MSRFLAGLAAWGTALVHMRRGCRNLDFVQCPGQGIRNLQAGRRRLGQKTGNTVKIVSTPNSATERLALYQQLLAAGAGDVDVFQIDVVWTGILGQPPSRPDAKAQGDDRRSFPAMVENNTRQRQAHGDALVRRCGPALLPQGPAGEIQAARAADLGGSHRNGAPVQEGERKEGSGDFWGFVWQGRAYEGLTTNALEWVAPTTAARSSTKRARSPSKTPRPSRP